MSKLTSILAASLAVGIAGAFIAAPAHAQGGRGFGMFKRADTNKDGTISKAEYQSARDTLFTAMDRDKNGTLDRVEIRAFVIKRVQERRAKRGAGRRGGRKIDANGDGKVTEQEFLNAQKSRFQRMDANKDGVLSAEELQNVRRFRRAMFRRMQHRFGRHNSRHGGRGFRGHKGRRGFGRLDINRDGKVTRSEFNLAGEVLFARLDQNADGKIERAELPRRGGRFARRSHHRSHRRSHR